MSISNNYEYLDDGIKYSEKILKFKKPDGSYINIRDYDLSIDYSLIPLKKFVSIVSQKNNQSKLNIYGTLTLYEIFFQEEIKNRSSSKQASGMAKRRPIINNLNNFREINDFVSIVEKSNEPSPQTPQQFLNILFNEFSKRYNLIDELNTIANIYNLEPLDQKKVIQRYFQKEIISTKYRIDPDFFYDSYIEINECLIGIISYERLVLAEEGKITLDDVFKKEHYQKILGQIFFDEKEQMKSSFGYDWSDKNYFNKIDSLFEKINVKLQVHYDETTSKKAKEFCIEHFDSVKELSVSDYRLKLELIHKLYFLIEKKGILAQIFAVSLDLMVQDFEKHFRANILDELSERKKLSKAEQNWFKLLHVGDENIFSLAITFDLFLSIFFKISKSINELYHKISIFEEKSDESGTASEENFQLASYLMCFLKLLKTYDMLYLAQKREENYIKKTKNDQTFDEQVNYPSFNMANPDKNTIENLFDDDDSSYGDTQEDDDSSDTSIQDESDQNSIEGLIGTNIKIKNKPRVDLEKIYYKIEGKLDSKVVFNKLSKICNHDEMEIIRLKLKDYSNKEIANKLNISESKISKFFRKLRLSSKNIFSNELLDKLALSERYYEK